MSDAKKICKRLFVAGRVQGVSFRFHTQERASQLGLLGWVRNLDDGRVEILAAGPSTSVDVLVKWAHRGPSGALVESVEVIEVKEPLPSDLFYIRRDGGK